MLSAEQLATYNLKSVRNHGEGVTITAEHGRSIFLPDELLAAICAQRAVVNTLPAQPDAQPVAWLHRHGNHTEVSERQLDEGEKARGWTQEPLFTHPAKVPAPPSPHADLQRREVDAVSEIIRAIKSLARFKSPLDLPADSHIEIVAREITASLGAHQQTEPRDSIVITLRQAEELLASFGGHDCEMVVRALEAGAVKMDDGEPESPAGLWAHCAEYPEEGCVYLGPTEVDDDLAARDRQADANQVEPAKCARCGADTADGCEGTGCGYLTACNGEQQVEPGADERAAWDAFLAAKSYPGQWREQSAFYAGYRAAQSGQRSGVADGWRISKEGTSGDWAIASPSGDSALCFHDDESPLAKIVRQLCETLTLAVTPTQR